jgi:NitT/TauT family transport system permease protein
VIYFASIKGAVLTVLAAFNSIPKIAVAPALRHLVRALASNRRSCSRFCWRSSPCSSIRSRALGEIEKDMLDLSKISGGNEWRIFTKVRLMHALPYIADSLKVAFPLALVGRSSANSSAATAASAISSCRRSSTWIRRSCSRRSCRSRSSLRWASGIVVLFEYLFLNWRPSQRAT